MSDDFSWNDTDWVVVKPQRAVAVYTNPDGDVVIRQEAIDPVGDEDPFVVLPADRVDEIIQAIRDVLEEADLGQN